MKQCWSNLSSFLHNFAISNDNKKTLFEDGISVKMFAFAAIILELFAGAMDLYLSRYESDFSTYTLALNNPGYIGIYLFGYAILISARLKKLMLPQSLTYFWVLALWLCRFVMRSIVVVPFGITYTAVIFILLPLFAKDKMILCLRR